jgi:hypothetical protein
MGIFNFNTVNTWDVALHHGHSAFRLLKIAYDIESEYTGNSKKLKSLPWGKSDYLQVSVQNQFLTTDMFRISSASIMMFQAMMEALINDSLEREPALSDVDKGSFRSKWETALETLKQDAGTFLKYFDAIYRKYRNPIVHPKDIELKSFNDISFLEILNGYYNGWDAFSKLYDGLCHPHDPDSWKTMCQTYSLPETVM